MSIHAFVTWQHGVWPLLGLWLCALAPACQSAPAPVEDTTIADAKMARILADLNIAEAATARLNGYPKDTLLIAYFSVHPPRTLKAAAAAIERLTNVTFSITQVRHFLLAIGLSRKKQAASPGSWMTPSEMSKRPLLAIS